MQTTNKDVHYGIFDQNDLQYTYFNNTVTIFSGYLHLQILLVGEGVNKKKYYLRTCPQTEEEGSWRGGNPSVRCFFIENVQDSE